MPVRRRLYEENQVRGIGGRDGGFVGGSPCRGAAKERDGRRIRPGFGVRVHEGIGKTDQPGLRRGVREGRAQLVILSKDGSIYWPIIRRRRERAKC